MKCPKCGFNSFEYYDNCKKCSADLIGYKQTHSITAIVLPLEAKEKLAAEFRTLSESDEQTLDAPESHDDIFSFDLPEDAGAGAVDVDDPFNFDEPASPTGGAAVKSDDDLFANLLETTSQADDSPFSAQTVVVDTPPVSQPAAPAFSGGPGEFDLESFSWDETPASSEAPVQNNVADDFDSLFGDTKDSESK
jgi:hypothetical protein